MPSRRAALDATAVVLTRALLSFACLASGFRAISDDDYSRVVIAQRFAHSPALDPSGSSWLPLPFWIYGGALQIFGDSLSVARAVAFVLGCASALLVWVAGKALGLTGRALLLGAVGASLLPYGAWLSVATVPEAPAAALILLGAASAAHADAGWRRWGALALGAACFCRYEAWPAAAAFAAITARDAWQHRRRELWPPVALALAAPLLWILHGAFRHGDAWFFVTRVSQYRAALGQAPTSVLAALAATPAALLRFEPELLALALVALGLSVLRRESPFSSSAWRPLAVLLALLLFLIAADASGGAATHHPERSLLAVFWFVALMTAGLVSRLAQAPARRWLLPALAAPAVVAASWLIRPDVRGSFVDRSEEELVGRMLRAVGAERVALDTDDYGFFAIQAALGFGKSTPLDDHDPRARARSRPENAARLAASLEAIGADWLVTTRARAPLSAGLGPARAETSRFLVIEIERVALAAR